MFAIHVIYDSLDLHRIFTGHTHSIQHYACTLHLAHDCAQIGQPHADNMCSTALATVNL